MNTKYGIVILNRYPELARSLLSSIRQTHSSLPTVIVVCDRHKEPLPHCGQLFSDDVFVFARNANVGICTLTPMDIILCNDDMACVQKDFFHRLHSIAHKYPKCGILSPLIDGGVGNEMQQYPTSQLWAGLPEEIAISGTTADSMPVCFPCVHIKRRVIDDIGPLDENMIHYGGDDNDYCIRARKAGYWTMITRQLHIRHGAGGNTLNRGVNWSLSFAKEPSFKNNQEYLFKKHSS